MKNFLELRDLLDLNIIHEIVLPVSSLPSQLFSKVLFKYAMQLSKTTGSSSL